MTVITGLRSGAMPVDWDEDPPGQPPPDDDHHRADLVRTAAGIITERDAVPEGIDYGPLPPTPVGFLNHRDGTPKEPRSW